LFDLIILLYYGVSAYLSYKMAVDRCLPAERERVGVWLWPWMYRKSSTLDEVDGYCVGSAVCKLTIDTFPPWQEHVYSLAEWKQWMVLSWMKQ